jgi:predicted amidohydrolase
MSLEQYLGGDVKNAEGHEGKVLRVAAVQLNSAGTMAENLDKIERAAKRAAEARADVVLFPECATTGYACDFGALVPRELRDGLKVVGEIARRLKINLIVGTPAFDARRRLYNGVVVFDRNGRAAHFYAKCQLTEMDRRWFVPGNSLSLFEVDGISATVIICHERRYPELVRFPVMAGAQLVFHPNAGMDALKVSKEKRRGRDGIAVRAFENAVYYVFANTVGPQGAGKWSAGDSKITGPDGRLLRLADNQRETVITAELDLALATRKYAMDSLEHPVSLARHWRKVLRELRRGVVRTQRRFSNWLGD